MTTSARAKAATPTENDLAIAEDILQRVGGALSLYDIFVLRAARVWHYQQRELAAERDGGLDSDGRKSQSSTLSRSGPSPPSACPRVCPPTRLTRTYVKLDPGPVQDQLDRAEVAAGYIYALHGVASDGEAASFERGGGAAGSNGHHPALGTASRRTTPSSSSRKTGQPG